MDEANAQEKANAAKAIKDECESDLAEVGNGKSVWGHWWPGVTRVADCLCRRHLSVEEMPFRLAPPPSPIPPPSPSPPAPLPPLQAIPIMNEALAALDTIKEADITYIKKLGNPPAAIKLVLEAVCVILDAKPAKVGVGYGGVGGLSALNPQTVSPATPVVPPLCK